MVNGEKTEWLVSPDHSTRLLGLELIDELLAKHVTLLRTSDTLLALTRDTLTKLLFKLFRVNDDYACLLRVLRIVLLFIVNFHTVLVRHLPYLDITADHVTDESSRDANHAHDLAHLGHCSGPRCAEFGQFRARE